MAHFLHVAMGSASELEYHLLLARDLKLLGNSNYELLATGAAEIKRMLTFLIRRVKADR